MIKKISNMLFIMVLILLPLCNIRFLPSVFRGWDINASTLPLVIGMIIYIPNIIIYLIKKFFVKINIIKFIIFIYLYIFINCLIMYFIFINKQGISINMLNKQFMKQFIATFMFSFIIIIYSYIKIQELKIKNCIRFILISMIIVLIYGYIQILSMITKNKFFIFIYTAISNNIDYGWRHAYIQHYVLLYQRLNLTTPEASEAAAIITMLLLPFLLSSILNNYSLFKIKIKFKLENIILIFTIPIIIFLFASSGYIICSLQVLLAIIIYLNKNKLNFKKILLFIFLGLILIFVILISTINSTNQNLIFYKILFYFNKIGDLTNMSTGTRLSLIVADFKVFLNYIINGCGLSNISVLINEYIPPWGFNQEMNSYISLGRLFTGPRVPYLIATNGLLFIILIVYFIKYFNHKLKKNNSELGNYIHDSFKIFLLGAILQGFNSSEFQFIYLWVILALYMVATVYDDNIGCNNRLDN